jgi:hypothetical protein
LGFIDDSDSAANHRFLDLCQSSISVDINEQLAVEIRQSLDACFPVAAEQLPNQTVSSSIENALAVPLTKFLGRLIKQQTAKLQQYEIIANSGSVGVVSKTGISFVDSLAKLCARLCADPQHSEVAICLPRALDAMLPSLHQQLTAQTRKCLLETRKSIDHECRELRQQLLSETLFHLPLLIRKRPELARECAVRNQLLLLKNDNNNNKDGELITALQQFELGRLLLGPVADSLERDLRQSIRSFDYGQA